MLISFTVQPHRLDTTTSFYAYDPYIERFWQPFLGPSATGLLNIASMEAHTASQFRYSLQELSRRIGTGLRSGQSSPVAKQLSRLCQFQLMTKISNDHYVVQSHIPALNDGYVRKLHSREAHYHESWIARLTSRPSATQQRKAGHLVMSMTMMGYDITTIRAAISRSGLHPSIIGKTLATLCVHNVA